MGSEASGEAKVVLCWLSVDPLAEKYPNIGGFVYCADNPINITDPTGMSVQEPPIGYDQNDGTVHSDYTGTWKYEKSSDIWRSQGVACDIENKVQLKEVSIANTHTSPAQVAGIIVLVGGGPEDPVGDITAGVVFTVLTLAAASQVHAPSISTRSYDDDVEDENQYITLYRGVSSYGKNGPKPQYFEALDGIAIPNGIRNGIAHSNMDDHAMGDNESIWTSWSINIGTAMNFAKGPLGNSSGVILTKRFKIGTEAVPNTSGTTKMMQEGEWLVPGIITSAEPTIVK